MPAKHKQLIAIDAWVNLLLGVLILLFPLGISDALGLPDPMNYFYTSILGGVIFGIGIALFLEWKRSSSGGLGLAGAIAINLSGGGVLLYWLVFGCLPGVTWKGHLILWFVCVLVLGIGIVELINQLWKKPGN